MSFDAQFQCQLECAIFQDHWIGDKTMKTLTSKFRSAIMVPNTKAPCSRRPGNLNQKLMSCHYGSAHVLQLSLFIFSLLHFLGRNQYVSSWALRLLWNEGIQNLSVCTTIRILWLPTSEHLVQDVGSSLNQKLMFFIRSAQRVSQGG